MRYIAIALALLALIVGAAFVNKRAEHKSAFEPVVSTTAPQPESFEHRFEVPPAPEAPVATPTPAPAPKAAKRKPTKPKAVRKAKSTPAPVEPPAPPVRVCHPYDFVVCWIEFK
jgi:predicted lipid-binding transport protein (Tim44 family)